MEYIRGLRKILKKKNQPPSICGEHRGNLEKFLRKKLATVNMWSTQDLEKFLSWCNGRRKTSHKKLSTLLHKPSLHKVQVSSKKAETAKNGQIYLCGERRSSIVQQQQCSNGLLHSAVLLQWCWAVSFLLFYSVCRSLLPVPGAEGSICKTEISYCFLVDFILRVTITRFQQAFK